LLVRGPDALVADAPDMAFVRYPSEQGDVPFLPGSSLKGVLRSGVEMLLRGLGERACRVTDRRDACKEASERCRACLMFGSKHGASAVLVEDGLPWPPGSPSAVRADVVASLEERRDIRAGVGIDRQTGAVRGVGPFDYEVLVDVAFFPTIRLRNPEPWQAAALAAGLDLFQQGVLRLGSSTSRGLGRVRIEPKELVVLALDQESPQPLLLEGLFAGPERAGPFWRYVASDARTVLDRWAASLEGWLRDAS
jgi:CRISPR/Cas system CSM-associated protein Csm3 (group 7 of RAMP superfamily)